MITVVSWVVGILLFLVIFSLWLAPKVARRWQRDFEEVTR